MTVCVHLTGEAIQLEVGAMDGAKRPGDRTRKVERRFEWSRFEGQLMASAYEQVLPIVRHPPATRQGPMDCRTAVSLMHEGWRVAVGA